MTQPEAEIPAVLLADFPIVNKWEMHQPRCYEYNQGAGMRVLAAVSDEPIPSRYESVEVLNNTIVGPRGAMVRGMAFRDLLRRVDGIGGFAGMK